MPEITDISRSENDYDEAQRLAAEALDHARRHKCPPKPRAYEIWYTYAAGSDDALRARVDQALINTNVVDLDTIEQIYEDHFLQKQLSRGYTRIGDELESGLVNTIGAIHDGLGSNRNYLSSLERARARLANVSRNHDAKRMVSELLDLSRDYAERTEMVGGELRHAREQVADLKRELAKLRDRAYLDHLTQIANRRHIDEVLEREIRLARESSKPLSFALADLDNFKRLNDTYGHAVGDAVLKHFGALLRGNVKGQDTPGRFGGEEFAIVFPRTSVLGAGTVAENIRRRLGEIRFILGRDGSPIGELTVSFGVTQLQPLDGMSDLVNRADALLYRAKKLGRNRVETDM